MTENANAFREFILKSAQRYLQTVVLIDDRIYNGRSGSVGSPLITPPMMLRKSALRTVKVLEVEAGEAELPDEASFHEVQNSFAKQRIICSLYQPEKSSPVNHESEIYNLCSVADVVVVDWNLHGDSGAQAKELVGNLIALSMEEIPHQLRLVLIYTMEANLGSVANELFETLKDRIGEESIGVEQELILTTSNSRVVVLGKRINENLSQYPSFMVPELELAERTIFEFSQLASGLLQAIVLRGIATLRENNQRILTRFHNKLDVAFLANRALVLPDETFGHILALLAEELRAVLEDCLSELPLGDQYSSEEIIRSWLLDHWQPGPNYHKFVGNQGDALGLASDLFCRGKDIPNGYTAFHHPNNNGKTINWNSEARCLEWAEFLLGSRQTEDLHAQLGALMCQRVMYDATKRALRLGVIVKTTETKLEDESEKVIKNEVYLLCLQPVCDSVRLKGDSSPFIFCRLTLVAPEEKHTHILVNPVGEVIRLKYQPSVANSQIQTFPTDSDVVYALNNSNKHVFTDINSAEYEWIGELKQEHAQRAAEQYSRELSRVGLNESEWLKLKSK